MVTSRGDFVELWVFQDSTCFYPSAYSVGFSVVQSAFFNGVGIRIISVLGRALCSKAVKGTFWLLSCRRGLQTTPLPQSKTFRNSNPNFLEHRW